MRKTITWMSLVSIGIIAVSLNKSSNISEYNPTVEKIGGAAEELGADKTGSPLSSGATCAQCHGTASASTSVSISVKNSIGSVVTEYTPGELYTMEFTVANTSLSSFGMQAVALNSSNGQAGTYGIPTSGNTQVITLNGKQYVEHSTTVTNAGGFTYIVPWTAPSIGSGDVDIYAAGLAVNNNGSTGGDTPSQSVSITLSEVIATAISYGNGSFCDNSSDPTPSITGNQTGTFSTSSSNLSLNSGTGVIDISNSLVGNYTVTYTYDGSETTTTDISIGQTFNEVDQVDLCENETYIFGSQTLTADDAGLNTEVFQSVTGCDSTVVLTVSVLSNSFSETVSICENETYTFGSQILTANDVGLNTEIFPNAMANGCDSIVNLTLEVKTNSFSEDVVICEGDTYVFGSQTLTANDIGLHTEIFPNAMVNGCDSIVNLNLEVQSIDISVSFESTGSTFSFMSNQNGATYQWLDCNNGSSMTIDSVEQTIQFVDEINANYAVEVTLNGCVDTSDCYNVAFLGIENEKNMPLTVYPNPTTESFRIQGLNKFQSIDRVYLINLKGEFLFEIKNTEENVEIIGLSPGIYYLIIENERSIEKVKIVKE